MISLPENASFLTTSSDTSRPKGLLPIPPEVIERCEQAIQQFQLTVTEAAKWQMLNDLALQFWYLGQHVVCRESD